MIDKVDYALVVLTEKTAQRLNNYAASLREGRLPFTSIGKILDTARHSADKLFRGDTWEYDEHFDE